MPLFTVPVKMLRYPRTRRSLKPVYAGFAMQLGSGSWEGGHLDAGAEQESRELYSQTHTRQLEPTLNFTGGAQSGRLGLGRESVSTGACMLQPVDSRRSCASVVPPHAIWAGRTVWLSQHERGQVARQETYIR